MPETRKHRIEARDALDEALFAALGEPLRPTAPGAQPDAADPALPTRGASAAAHPATFVVRGTTLGGFTFGGGPQPGTAATED